MLRHLCIPICATITAIASLGAVEEIPKATDRVVEKDGVTQVLPRWSTDGVANPWPASYEKAFQKRVSDLLPLFKGTAGANTTGEREKYDYPQTVGAFLAGDHAEAIKVLEGPDVDGGDHAWLGGIDLYWGFTLKAQALKFFYLEDQLTPAYRDTMLKAFETFTASDPRPTLEYALNTESTDAEVAAFATEQLTKMWRSKDEAKAMAEKALEEGHPNKQRFGNYILSILDRWPDTKPGSPDEWQAWWGLIADGDWMIFEEFERRANPNPHPKFGTGSGPVGATWNPAVRGMRADARNTDNLRGMREGSIYLFAERSGNELLRKLYKDRIRRTALGFWEMGNGEWDSGSYHPHTIAAYMNLYAFAQDQEVRAMSKAILDFLFTAGAVKYWRGAWSGPNKRDYGNYTPMTSVSVLLWMYFGDTPLSPKKHLADNVWAMVSGYRPPAALVAFAHKEFDKPLEMFNSHPAYSNWLPGEGERPEFFETMYYANTYNLGTLAKGSRGDVSGFRLTTFDSKQGAAIGLGATGSTKRLHNGSGQDRIGQYQNLAVLLAPGTTQKKNKKTKTTETVPNSTHFIPPLGAAFETVDGITFIKAESTWAALTPIAGEAFTATKRKVGKGGKGPEVTILTTVGTGSEVVGYALEVGEAESHGDYDAFKAAVAGKASVTLDGTTATLTASDGRTLAVTRAGGLPVVLRDGVAHDWASHDAVYQSVDSTALNLLRDKRVLEVNAGGHSFRGELAEDGTYTWQETIKE